MKKEQLWRAFFYSLGVVVLSIGITLNTKTGLGLACVSAVPYSFAQAFAFPFSSALFWYYVLCVVFQVVVRKGKVTWKEAAQFPLSYAFSAIQAWVAGLIRLEFTAPWQPYAVLPLAVICTGFGIALMVDMELVPNPADGVPAALSQVMGKEMGFCKNLMDMGCVAIALTADLLLNHRILSVGVGTIAAMLFNGRAVAMFDRLFKKKIKDLAGL